MQVYLRGADVRELSVLFNDYLKFFDTTKLEFCLIIYFLPVLNLQFIQIDSWFTLDDIGFSAHTCTHVHTCSSI